jgi:nicotinamide-nucleotide amidase
MSAEFQEKIDAILLPLAARLMERGSMLAAAESCTGGWIAKCCTDYAGSSNWFERGFVTYSNAAKNGMLQVSEQLIEEQGAVSEDVALAMVAGAIANSVADAALAVTGIAGPDGGSEDKPVGTVCFAWSYGGRSFAQTRQFAGDRNAVREQTVVHALAQMLECVAT